LALDIESLGDVPQGSEFSLGNLDSFLEFFVLLFQGGRVSPCGQLGDLLIQGSQLLSQGVPLVKSGGKFGHFVTFSAGQQVEEGLELATDPEVEALL
jgi:hypothetical protein